MTDLHVLSTPTRHPVLRPVRRDGSRVVAFLDATGATVAVEVPVADYKGMSPSVKSDVDGRPHLETWCNVHGRVQVPVTLLDLFDQPLRPVTRPVGDDADRLIA